MSLFIFILILNATRKQVVFTTHTPIKQGNEEHPIERLKYMGAFNGLTIEQMLQIGGDPFNMTGAALRTSKRTNAVAKLHAETANKMWEHVDYPKPIIGITNAIHVSTWVDERSNFIFSAEKIIDLLLRNKKIQIVFSGKAHPLDDTGKVIVTNLVNMSKKYPDAVVLLENYDMTIGKMLTRGSDIWLNNPRRPLEASGTSGMKAAMNRVLNFSVLDGWWPEACQHGVNGWQIGDGFESSSQEEQDYNDLKSLYNVLLNEIIPTYYNNRAKWVEMMKNSIESTGNEFSVDRMLKEYFERLYMN